MYQSSLAGCAYRVNLVKRTCSCKKWDACGIPCQHAYGVILEKKLLPEDYVNHWFRTTLWRRNYTEGIIPVRGAAFWPGTDTPDVHPPPGQNKKVTKADKKRRRGVNESPTKGQPLEKKRTLKCGICKAVGHNSRFHKNDNLQVCKVTYLY